MRVCVYLEGKGLIRTGGVRTAYNNRVKACRYGGMEVLTSLSDQDFDILQIEFPGVNSLFYAKRMRKKGKKVVIGTHITAEDFKDTFVFGDKIFPYLRRFLKFAYSSGNALISPSVYTKKLVLSYGVNRPVYVLSNGIDPKFLKSANRKKKEEDDFVIGCVGFVTKRKGVLTFAHLAKRFPEFTFRWVGDIRKNLLFDVEKLKSIPNLQFTGYVEDIRREYEKFDVFLFPSYEENQGIVLLEAGAYSLPLIVRDIPVYEGWLHNRENCIKCSTDGDFEKALEEIINNKNLREKLSRNSRRLAEQHSLEIVGKKLRKIYEEVLSSNSSM